jgi:glucose-1-phosphate thymidylyltransferase
MTKKCLKGVILSGGSGTRLLPLTLVTSKQLLPVYDKPMIYYPLAILMMAGIRDVMIVSTSQDLYRFQRLFEDGSHLGLKISYGVQEEPKGIAHALLVAEEFVGNDHVALVLGDNIFYAETLHKTLAKMSHPESGATIFGYEVHSPERYGVLRLDEAGKPIEILEKPKHPPSNFAVTGLYFYDDQVMEICRNLKPSGRGELEITDVNNVYLKKGELGVVKLGRGSAWFDSGTFEDLQKASTYVQIIQETHNIKIACIEEIAFNKGYISKEQLKKLADLQKKSSYGEYLSRILDRVI